MIFLLLLGKKKQYQKSMTELGNSDQELLERLKLSDDKAFRAIYHAPSLVTRARI